MARVRAIGIAVLALAAAGARADIYRCEGPNGEVRFTSNAAQCPHAAPHEPRATTVQVQSPASAAPLTSARPVAPNTRARVRAAASPDDSGAEQAWREKKTAAQRTLAEAKARAAYLDRAVTFCKRGNYLYTEDDATGLRQDVKCDDVEEEARHLDESVQELEQYLAEGLEEECRQAGCLPGWLRD